MKTCVFSKHLQPYGYDELGTALESIGMKGVDLTVRPKGHVEPSQVKDKLPEAVETLAKHGVEVTMITTAITSLDDLSARDVIETAAGLGVGFYKFGYYLYDGFGMLASQLREANARLRDLAAFSREKGIFGGYHNHSGEYLGSTVPHMLRLLDGVDPQGAGVFFDVAHATVEGSLLGWMQGLEDVLPRVRMLAIKDFVVEKAETLSKAVVVPMGEGLVQWREYVAIVKTIEKQVGVLSVHAEYDAAPAEVLALAKQDRDFWQSLWSEPARPVWKRS